ncbi:patatin-like phospholipase domain-containing protein 4 isoform X2 [Canis lupus baileyi]|uniref:patatin-like phospholipase domain-containing protein 4 isoform X2 n=1 Tax=Canis lupus baileyi TaxID=143281 RepID=UPI003B974764
MEVPGACLARMKHINLSFAACGFLGIYHLGAASALCRHGKKLLKDVKAFAGASAGSLVASVLLTAPEKLEECNEFTYKFAEEIRRQSFGAVTPGYDFMARLRSGMELILPPNAHELAHNRLHVSITNTKTRENYLVSSFSSREDLIKVLLASSFVPIYAGLKPVEYQGQSQRERERGRDKGRGRSRLHAPGARRGIRSRVSRIAPWAKGRRQTTAPPRDPRPHFLTSLVESRTKKVLLDISIFSSVSYKTCLQIQSNSSGHISCSWPHLPNCAENNYIYPEVGRWGPHEQPSHPACRPDGDHLTLQWTTGHLPTG